MTVLRDIAIAHVMFVLVSLQCIGNSAQWLFACYGLGLFYLNVGRCLAMCTWYSLKSGVSFKTISFGYWCDVQSPMLFSLIFYECPKFDGKFHIHLVTISSEMYLT